MKTKLKARLCNRHAWPGRRGQLEEVKAPNEHIAHPDPCPSRRGGWTETGDQKGQLFPTNISKAQEGMRAAQTRLLEF